MERLSKYDKLINELLFGKYTNFKIEVMDYIKDIYNSDEFVADTKIIIKRGKVQIVKEKVIVDKESVIWEFTIKR
jgi:hypothetical protein